MYNLTVGDAKARPLRILCLGAHADDIEIGCGGLLLKLVQRPGGADIDWIVLSARGRRADEARLSARRFLTHGRPRLTIKSFRDGFFPYDGARIKQFFEQLKRKPSPDLVLTHYRDDRHQDH